MRVEAEQYVFNILKSWMAPSLNILIKRVYQASGERKGDSIRRELKQMCEEIQV